MLPQWVQHQYFGHTLEQLGRPLRKPVTRTTPRVPWLGVLLWGWPPAAGWLARRRHGSRRLALATGHAVGDAGA